MDIEVDYAQLPAGPASGLSPKFLAQAVYEITTPYNLGEEQAPLRQQISTYMPIYTYSFLA